MNSRRFQAAFAGFASLALVAWIFCAVSTVVQKMNADKTIRGSDTISAIHHQQLNSSVTAHALTMLLVACAATIPLLLFVVSAIVNRLAYDEKEMSGIAESAEPTEST
jgi:hypothetical protein